MSLFIFPLSSNKEDAFSSSEVFAFGRLFNQNSFLSVFSKTDRSRTEALLNSLELASCFLLSLADLA